MFAVLALSLLVSPVTLSPREVIYGLAHDLRLFAATSEACAGPAEHARERVSGIEGLNYLTSLPYHVEGSDTVVRQWLDIRGRQRALAPVNAWTEDAQRRSAWREYTLHHTPRIVYQAVVARQRSGSDVCFNLFISTTEDPGAVLTRLSAGR